MTPGPRGLPRTFAALAVLAVVLALPVATAAGEGPLCDGEAATPGVTMTPTDGGYQIVGTPRPDVIVGTDGNDVIYGMGGDDLICAGAGDDVVLGGRGNDVVYGEAGDDLILGGPGNDTLSGGEGNDQISGDAGRDVISGDAGNDVLYGGGGPDIIFGGDGDDKIFGETGRDRLYGGDGDDELQGGSEGDRLYGDAGNDYLWGDHGDDVLIGGVGDDLLQGGPGADNLQGRAGFDELWGSECYEIHPPFPHFCRATPSGRPPAGGDEDPGDVLNGGPGFDACNRGASEGACETDRGWRPLAPWVKTAAEEWRAYVVQAFEERVAYILEHPEEYPLDPGPGPEVLAQMVEDEIEHAMQIVACESLGDPFQVTPFYAQGTTVDGLFQHSMRYWQSRSAAAGIPGASPFDPLANARVAAWLVADSLQRWWDGAPGGNPRPAWFHWACDEAIMRHDPSLWEPLPVIRRTLSRAEAAWAARQRTSGEPRSGNGASSFHLIWDLPPVPLKRVAATLEVVVPPRVPRLYFWALQVSFAAGPSLQGGAHLGLQWHPRYPGSTAVNFGGYGPADGGTRLLEGTTSELPGSRRNPNTRDFAWQLGHRYRLEVAPAPEAPEGIRAWRGTVEDLDGGAVQVVRDLYTRGEYLHSPLVWSEVFARCEHPSVVVRWSDLRATAASGEELRPEHVRVDYQTHADGGCDNTSVGLDELGLLQITAVQREVPQAAVLPVPGA